ncbi:hypothetical protein CIHG_09579 [Coccidioides immitis H538.4]|uniref:Uncharacterized protein n=1 Tax=Coccidioides immitis H538.4 TaxID=396776 RepID=A0A0J8UVE8_COCIT|nr:hypothetical protein CIHG_09579 [Coccidioides immitis H538.4]
MHTRAGREGACSSGLVLEDAVGVSPKLPAPWATGASGEAGEIKREIHEPHTSSSSARWTRGGSAALELGQQAQLDIHSMLHGWNDGSETQAAVLLPGLSLALGRTRLTVVVDVAQNTIPGPSHTSQGDSWGSASDQCRTLGYAHPQGLSLSESPATQRAGRSMATGNLALANEVPTYFPAVYQQCDKTTHRAEETEVPILPISSVMQNECEYVEWRP